jgi:F-type H+-transporting ATPase subunit a
MILLAAEGINPLGHVVDKPIVGGEHPLFHRTEDLTILGSPLLTIHMVTLLIAAIVTFIVLWLAAQSIRTGHAALGNERFITRGRLGQLVEVILVTLRDQMLRPLLGNQTDRYLPYLMTLFFFILINNLMGLIPLLDVQGLIGGTAQLPGGTHWAILGGTATGNMGVNAGLALISFLVIQVHGIQQLGFGGWANHLLGGAPPWLAPIMVPVEIMGMIIKPCALAIRLFANMLAGHTLMATLALFGFMAYEGLQNWFVSVGISVVSGAFALAIYFLELFVAFLQAFVFMFLTAVFISQLSHHGDHGDEHEHSDEHAMAAPAPEPVMA